MDHQTREVVDYPKQNTHRTHSKVKLVAVEIILFLKRGEYVSTLHNVALNIS